MKRIFAYFATFFLISTCASLPSLKENEQRYNAKMSDTPVQNLFDYLVDNQEDTVLNNYSTVYFSNLTSNFPINSHGTCAYVAISTILSFYDSYWDDDFVLEDLEQAVSYASTVSTNQNLDLSPIDNESPGVISEDIEDVENLTMIQYQNFILANQNNYLQSYLIKLAYNMFGGYRFDNLSNPYGMTLYEQTHLAMYYLIYRRNITSNRAIVTSCGNVNQNDLCDYIISRLVDGVPVIINPSSSVGYHSVIAYDYDSENDVVYVHAGWEDSDGNALTHVSLDQLGISLSSIDGALAIESTDTIHGYECPHYISSSNTGYCSCQLVYPRNIQITSGNYIDIAPTFKWDSLYEEKWFEEENPYIELSITTGDPDPLISYDITSGNECTLSEEEWYLLNMIDPAADFSICLKLVSASHEFLENYYIKQFDKPSELLEEEPIVVTSTNADYTGYTDAYETNADIKNNFLTHTTTNGFIFKTRRFRAGYIHDECIVLSPKRLGHQEAFIEYQFIVPVDRIDIELSHWREVTTEGLTSSTGQAVIEVFRYGEYSQENVVLDLLASSTNLSEDRNDKTTYKLCFDRPITRFRIYASTNLPNVNDNNRGRICVGNMTIYENIAYKNHSVICDMETTGYECPYEPELWNDINVVNSYNCYGYALNYQGTEGVPISPGFIGDHNNYVSYHRNGTYYTIEAIQVLVQADAAPRSENAPETLSENGFVFSPLNNKYSTPSEDAYRVALAFDLREDYNDYHWYRQNPDGTWSHKPSNGEVRDFDFDGNPILDPEFCNRKSNPLIDKEKQGIFKYDYSSLTYYFEVDGFYLGV